MNSAVKLIVYRNDDSGPSRGAFALCKVIDSAEIIPVFTSGYHLNFNLLCLLFKPKKNWVVIGFGLLPDFFSYLMFGAKLRISYLRGDININYRDDFGFFSSFFILMHKFLLAKMDMNLFLTQANADAYRQCVSKRALIIPNLVDISGLGGDLNYVCRNMPNINVVGSLTARKCPQDAILIANILRHKYNIVAEVNFFGDGPLLSELKVISHEMNVVATFYGAVSNPYEQFYQNDILLHTSISEGASRAVLEALAFGFRVVSSNWPGVSEVIDDKKNGYIFRDLDQAAEIIYQMINDKYLRESYLLDNYHYSEISKVWNNVVS